MKPFQVFLWPTQMSQTRRITKKYVYTFINRISQSKTFRGGKEDQFDNTKKDIGNFGKSVFFHSKALQILNNIKNNM